MKKVKDMFTTIRMQTLSDNIFTAKTFRIILSGKTLFRITLNILVAF